MACRRGPSGSEGSEVLEAVPALAVCLGLVGGHFGTESRCVSSRGEYVTTRRHGSFVRRRIGDPGRSRRPYDVHTDPDPPFGLEPPDPPTPRHTTTAGRATTARSRRCPTDHGENASHRPRGTPQTD